MQSGMQGRNPTPRAAHLSPSGSGDGAFSSPASSSSRASDASAASITTFVMEARAGRPAPGLECVGCLTGLDSFF